MQCQPLSEMRGAAANPQPHPGASNPWPAAPRAPRLPTRRAVSPAQSKIGVSVTLGGDAAGSGKGSVLPGTPGQPAGTRSKSPPRGACGGIGPEGSPAAARTSENSLRTAGHRTASRLPARGASALPKAAVRAQLRLGAGAGHVQQALRFEGWLHRAGGGAESRTAYPVQRPPVDGPPSRGPRGRSAQNCCENSS